MVTEAGSCCVCVIQCFWFSGFSVGLVKQQNLNQFLMISKADQSFTSFSTRWTTAIRHCCRSAMAQVFPAGGGDEAQSGLCVGHHGLPGWKHAG